MSIYASENEERTADEANESVANEGEVSKTKNTDNVGQTSVEIDVEHLISELEAEKPKGVDKDGDLRKRLDEILDKKRSKHDLDDFDDYELED